MNNLEKYLTEIQERCDAAKGDEDFMALLEFNSRSQQDVAVLLEMVGVFLEGLGHFPDSREKDVIIKRLKQIESKLPGGFK